MNPSQLQGYASVAACVFAMVAIFAEVAKARGVVAFAGVSFQVWLALALAMEVLR